MKKLFILSVFTCFIVIFSIGTLQKTVTADELIPSDSKITIPIIVQNEATFWDPVLKGAQQAAKEYNVEIEFQAPQAPLPDSIEEQLNLFKQALEKKPSAIILSALNPAIFKPYLEQAQAENVPVVGLIADVYSPIVSTSVSTDNYAAGELAAQKMVELIDGKGKIGIITPNPTGKNFIDRLDGFVTTMNQNYPDIEILPIQTHQYNVDKIIEQVKNLVATYPDIKGIFGANQSSSEGIIEAIKELRKDGEIKIIGFNSGKVITDAIEQGIVSGAVTQDPENLGYKAVEAAVAAYNEESLPELINSPFRWYDKSNINTPEIQALLYD